MLLVIEVADSTLDYDRDIKLPLYARHGIAEAWLVDVSGKRLTLNRRPSVQGYLESLEPETLTAIELSGLTDVKVNLEKLF